MDSEDVLFAVIVILYIILLLCYLTGTGSTVSDEAMLLSSISVLLVLHRRYF